MKVIQAGLGDFGFSWFKDIILPNKEIEVLCIIDKNTDSVNKIKSLNIKIPFYTDLNEALNNYKPDFILNFTPPAVHSIIDMIAFDHKIPVLSEKPIAENYNDAINIFKESLNKKVPVMIAENYRYSNIMRTLKKHVAELGKLDSIQVNFRRNHHMTNYHKDLKHPLLLDVTIHHIDLMRYLTGAQCLSVYAQSWTPFYSWYKGYSDLNLLLEMQNNIHISYSGSLSGHNNETDWYGDWFIEGEKGILKFSHDTIYLKTNEEREIKVNESCDSRFFVLEEFIGSLKENRKGETDISDNIKTMEIIYCAIKSIEISQRVESGKDKFYDNPKF